MDNIQHNEVTPALAPDAIDIEPRLRRFTLALIVLGVIAAFVWSDLKMTLGFALGGVLSLFNERWLNASTKAILEFASETGNPSAPSALKFIFRIVVIGVVIVSAAKTGYFNLLGVGIGFTAFVGAVMIEAVYQLITYKD